MGWTVPFRVQSLGDGHRRQLLVGHGADALAQLGTGAQVEIAAKAARKSDNA
jgi:hypothetical protein